MKNDKGMMKIDFSLTLNSKNHIDKNILDPQRHPRAAQNHHFREYPHRFRCKVSVDK